MHRISPTPFLQLKIQLQMVRFEPGPPEYQSNAQPTELDIFFHLLVYPLMYMGNITEACIFFIYWSIY